MDLIILFGPPAVGKMAVGKALSHQTGLPLFHNHMSIEPVLPLFEFGSPPFFRLVNNFRRAVFKEVAQSDLPGLIYTYVWSLADENDTRSLAGIIDLFDEQRTRVTLVELRADLSERLKRNRGEERLLEKASKRDLSDSETRLLALEQQHQMNSAGSIPLEYDHLLIDNTHLSPGEVAEKIRLHLRL